MTDAEDRIREHFRRAANEPSPDDLLLRRLRAEAAARHRRRRVLTSAAAAAVVVAVAGAALTLRDDGPRVRTLPPAAEETTTTTAAPTSTTAPSTTASGELSALDWDDVRFDFGIVRGLVQAEQGTWRLSFDRVSHEGRSAADFMEEPVVYGNTDASSENANTRLRDYRVAANAEVLELANLAEVCQFSGEGDRPEPRWTTRTLAETASRRLYEGYDQTAVTFDPKGIVMRIRLSKGC